MLVWSRRILSILFVAWLLVACSTTLEVDDNRNGRESSSSEIIVLWQSYPQSYLTESLISGYRELFAQYIEKFTKLYPQVKIITELIPADELVEELEREVEKGLGPDLIYAPTIYSLPLCLKYYSNPNCPEICSVFN